MTWKIPTTAMLLAAALALPAAAADFTLGQLKVEQPWARATPGAARNGAAYMVITNAGNAPDQLIAAASPVADKVELHTHVVEGDIMRMRPVKAIDINVGEPAVLRPGGLHIMLIGLKQPLQEGQPFPLTLTFANAGSLTVTVDVVKAGADTHRH